MDITGIARAVACVLLAVALAAAIPTLAAAFSGQHEALIPFLLTMAGAGFLGGVLWLAVRGRHARTTPREAIVALLLCWLVGAGAAGPALIVPEGSWTRGVFDALSAVTTTGFPPAAAAEADWIRLLWWNVLQWMGGAGSLIAILAALAALNIVGAGVQKSTLFTLTPEHLLRDAARLSRIVFTAYGAATVFVGFGAWAAGAQALDALCVALASVSTGGLVMLDGTVSASRLPNGALAFAALGLTFGALSFALHWEALRSGRLTTHLQDRETILFFCLFWLWLALAVFKDPPHDGADAWRVSFEALALTSTAAWDAGTFGVSALGASVLFSAVLFGGAAISTTGGLKLQRVIMLVREIGMELRALAHPSSVSANGVGRPGSDHMATVSGLGVYAVGYGAALCAVIIGLGAFGNAPLDVAVGGAAAALANAGPMLAAAIGQREVDALLSRDAALLALSVGMMLGRVEVIAAFALFIPSFWRG